MFPNNAFLKYHDIERCTAKCWPTIKAQDKHQIEWVKEFQVEYRTTSGKWKQLQRISCSRDFKKEVVHSLNDGKGKLDICDLIVPGISTLFCQESCVDTFVYIQ